MKPRVLVAESSRTLATLMRLTLEPEGYDLEFVASGVQALRSLRVGAADLVILDAGLPDIDGYDVAETLRSQPSTADVPILLTVHDYEPPDRARIGRARIADVLSKPFERQALLMRVRDLVPAVVEEASPVAPVVPPPQRGDRQGHPSPPTQEAVEEQSRVALEAAVSIAVERAVAQIGPRLDALLAARLEQALDTEVRQLVKSKAESIVWKATAELAEDIIREEISRLTKNDGKD